MEKILELLKGARLEGFLGDCAEAFGSPVFILDGQKRVVMKSGAQEAPAELASEPLSIKDVQAYVAVAANAGAAKALGFISRSLSEMLRMSYDIHSLSSEVARNYEELTLLWRLSERLGAGLNVDKICSVLVDEVMNFCPSSNVSVMLLSETPTAPPAPCIKGPAPAAQPQVRLLFPKVSAGADSSRASMMTLSPEAGILGHAFEKKHAVTVSDVSKDERFEGFPYPVRSLLIVPLIVEDTVIGAVVANDKLDGEEYYSTDIKLISGIASESSVSIKKALLFDEIRNMLFGITESFAFAIDAKHPYTYGHSKRVSELSVEIAREAGLQGETLSWVRLAGLLHDIGKIGTPEVILDKDSKLDPEEMKRIRQHTVIGSKMIVHIQRMREIAQWVCHHHEKFDGTGYPYGLKGEAIPLPSRIIAIADYYDALASDRSYRKAYSKEEALKIMSESVGTHFDPVMFDCFRRVIMR